MAQTNGTRQPKGGEQRPSLKIKGIPFRLPCFNKLFIQFRQSFRKPLPSQPFCPALSLFSSAYKYVRTGPGASASCVHWVAFPTAHPSSSASFLALHQPSEITGLCFFYACPSSIQNHVFYTLKPCPIQGVCGLDW